MGYFLQGRQYSGSSISTSGSTQEMVAYLETLLSQPNIIIKRMIISSASPNKVKINDNNYWSDMIREVSGSFVIRTNPGEIYVSSLLFQSASGSGITMDIVY